MNKTGAGFNKSGFKFSMQKIEGAYIYNLQEIIRLLSQIINKLCDQDAVSTLDIGQLNKLHSQLKYHQKMKNSYDEEHGPLNQYVQQALGNLQKQNQQFPKIKHMNSNYRGELATIAEKYSQENLLSNYLRKNNQNTNSKYRRLSQLQRHSETLNIDSQIYRQQTKRSLDNSQMQNNRKPIYSELQKLKEKETRNSPNKVLVDQGRKFIIKSKLPNYTISKLI